MARKDRLPFDIGFGSYARERERERKSISKGLRDQVWLKYMGDKTQGKCYCCRIKPIHFTDYEVGHNKSVAKRGKNHISNLRPVCRSCNRAMGTKSIEWYRKKYFGKGTKKVTKRKKKPSPKKLTNIFGLPNIDF